MVSQPCLAAACLAITLPAAVATAQSLPETVGQPSSPSPAAGSWWRSSAIGLGPLEHSSGTPASVFRLGYLPHAPATVGKGQWQVHAHVDWANYFCNGGERYFLDYESLRYRIGVAYGLGERTQIALGSSASYQGGGVLDGFIEAFERSISASSPDRLDFPRNRYMVRVRGDDGVVHEVRHAETGWHVEGVYVQVMQQLLDGTERRPSLVASGVIKFPVASDVPGRPGDSFDVGAGLGVGQRLGRFNVYGGLGLVVFGNSSTPGVELATHQVTISAALEYRATRRTSLLVQSLFSSPVARHLGELSEPVREVAVGVKHRVGRDVLLELSAEENVLLFSNSADIAFHSGLTWKL